MAERKRRRVGDSRSASGPGGRSPQLRSGLSILPSLFTVGNIFCAYYSVMSTLNGKWDQAALAIGIGYILDGLDGRVARLTGTSTEFGAQLDSLADVLTFGIAPAILAFAWGIAGGANGLGANPAPLDPFEQHVRSAGWLVTFGFVICGALRLARFNVQAQKPVDSTSKRFFVGLPIPAGAGLIASIVHFWKEPLNDVYVSLAWCALIGLTAFLMISTVRYNNFKELGIVSRRPRVALVIAAMMIALIFRYSEQMLLLFAVVYAASGPVAKLIQMTRKFPLLQLRQESRHRWNPDVNPERLKKAPNISIVGSTSPLGKELRELIEGAEFPVGKLSLLETEEYAGLLQEFAGEIRITQIISPESFADTDIAFFACSPEIINAYAESGAAFPELTIDLTQTGRDGTLFLGGVSKASDLKAAGYYVNPHPASIALGRVLARIQNAFPIEAVSATVMEPASERGLTGIDELQEQTVGLLNFQPVEHKTFSGQLAFNLLSDARASRQTENLVRGQLTTLLGKGMASPGVAAVQAPVFHSHAVSVFLQLKGAPTSEQVRAALQVGGSSVIAHSDEGLTPSPVTVVGSDAVQVGRIAADPVRPGCFFLWLVADNLRVAASNGLQIAESLMFTPAQPR